MQEKKDKCTSIGEKRKMNIELVKPEWVYGSEKRFYDFISNLGKEKIVLISHIADLDGVTSAKIVNKIVNADLIKFVDYSDVNLELAKEIKKFAPKKIIMTDLMINFPEVISEFEKFAEILIIDHHSAERDYNTNKIVYLNAQGFCASYLCYYLFSRIENLESFDWLVACASVSDWLYTKNGIWMDAIYKKYGEKFEGTMQGVKNGKFWKLVITFALGIMYFRALEGNPRKVFDKIGEGFGNIGDLDKYGSEVQEEINEKLKDFQKKKVKLKEGWFYEFESKYPIKSTISNDISEKDLGSTLIIAQKGKRLYDISCRRQDGKYDMNAFLREITQGLSKEAGGHFRASGTSIKIEDRSEFLRRIDKLK